mmetsp:Transcript_20461/g.40583  ORF Transcript_20461/g.40583 Transcript_20461/m.40583 type:complete len:186 (-) Transcript_20461:214-771(-)
MQREIEMLKEELKRNKLQAEELGEIVRASTSSDRVTAVQPTRRNLIIDPGDDIREELESLREEIKMQIPRASGGQRARFASEYASPPPPPQPSRATSSSAYGRRAPQPLHRLEDEEEAHLNRLSRKSIISPRFSHRDGRGGYGDDYDEDMGSRYDAGRSHLSTPPLRHASPRSRPSGILKSRYYF